MVFAKASITIITAYMYVCIYIYTYVHTCIFNALTKRGLLKMCVITFLNGQCFQISPGRH